jgi:hypothetical protein
MKMNPTRLTTLFILGMTLSLSAENNFSEDLSFLQKHSDARVLKNGQAQIIVVPQWQGRVMTSTATGPSGDSYGWINYEVVKNGILPEEKRKGLEKHIYIFGGEERFWLGPEGGQYALFFKPGEKEYSFEHWKTPALLDTDSFDLVSATPSKMTLARQATLKNNMGTEFKLALERTVEVLNREVLAKHLGVTIPENLKCVAYETTNVLTNKGDKAWSEDTGMLSIWMLGMLKHGPKTNVVIPLKPGKAKAVNTDYFGEVGSDRLKIKGDLLFFKADGKFRSKIGITPQRCENLVGSYDPDRKTLTIVQFNLPPSPETLPYVRSQWVKHEHPYQGDVINAYNDGSPEPEAKPLGPFYEIETSSPALPLEPSKSITHIQRTIHIQGDAEDLNIISKKLFGISVEEISRGLE